jgi:hypothetical protein
MAKRSAAMELKLFADLIDALDKIARGLKAAANFPKDQRDRYRQTMDETYRLIDTALNMVIIRLGDIMLCSDKEFVEEVGKLDNYSDWMRAEREFRLCKSLRAALSETEKLRQELIGKIITKDWDALCNEMRNALTTEQELALFIAGHFNKLVNSINPQKPHITREQVKRFREELVQKRRELIERETEMYSFI